MIIVLKAKLFIVKQLREWVNNVKGFSYAKTKQSNKYLWEIGCEFIQQFR